MLKKRHEKKEEEDGQSLKQMNALVDNNINAWISCEQANDKLKDISVEKRTAGCRSSD